MAEIYVPGAIDIMGSANQMMQFRNSQQAQQANALQMQYAAEDRARAAQERKAAAGNALAERAALSKALEYSVVGGAGPEQPNLGRAADTLAKQGRFGSASTISNYLEQIAKQEEQQAKATGQGLTNVKTGVETDEKRADVTKKAIEIQRQSFDYAQDLPTLKALITASYTPGHPLSEFHAINGVTLDQALKSIDDLAAQGVPFETIRERMSQGASKAAENIAARGLVTAQTDKAKGEAGASKAGVFGDTNEGRQLQIVNEVLKGTRLPSDPEYALAYDALYAGKSMPAYNPDTKQMELVKAPATAPANLPPPTFGKASVAATPPLTMASVASNLRPPVQTNALSTMNGALRPPVQANALVASPDAPIITNAPSAPSSARETQTITEENKKAGAKAALDFIGFDPATGKTSVDKLLPTSTSGSMEQLGADFFATFGASTEGSKAIAQLETIASTLALELAGGKLGAGFSNEDRRFLLTTLGDVSNSVKPVQDRLAAWKTAKRYMAQKAGVTLPEDHAENATPKETTETYATAKTLVDKINASNMSQERKTELINKVYEKLTISGYDPAKVK